MQGFFPQGTKNEHSKTDDFETHVQMDSEGFKIPPVPNKLPQSPNSRHDSHNDLESEKRKRPSSSKDYDEAQESKKRKGSYLD